MALGEARPKFRARGIGTEECIGDAVLAAEALHVWVTATAAGEHKPKASIICVLLNHSGNCFDIVRKAEVAGIMHDERPLGKRQRGDFRAICPILCDVYLVFWNIPRDQSDLHLLTQHDDAVSIPARPVR